MTIKLITRLAAGLAATSIAALPLIIGTSAHAINKHEQSGQRHRRPDARDRT